MEPILLSSLWLPILLSAVVVHVASFITWMVLPYHRTDWSKMPNEDEVRDAVRGMEPGEYTLLHAADPKEWNTDDWKKKAEEGPMGFLTVMPSGMPKMGKQLGLWFTYCLAMSTLIAYAVTLAVPAGGDYMKVFRVASTVGFLAYAMGHFPGAIWMGHRWSRALKGVFDGLVYALLTAGVMGWLWP